MQYALITSGPLLASIKWYDSYSFINNYQIVFNTKFSFGYHAIAVLGWTAQGWLCQNSWGVDWGDEGRFILPFDNKFIEVWSFVDENNTKKPVFWLKFLYKIINRFLGNSQ